MLRLQAVVFCASVVKHCISGAYHGIRKCAATRGPNKHPIDVCHLRRSNLVVVACRERLMHGVGAHVTNCGKYMLSELTLYVQVPVHGVGSFGMRFRKCDL